MAWPTEDYLTPFARGGLRASSSFGGKPKAPDLTPEEEESLTRKLARQGMGALGWVGETLDKPGSAVRGMLSGVTGGDFGGGLLNLIPFSDTLGITDPEKRVGGRKLLEQWGALDSNTPGLDWGDVAGFALEIGTDPLTYVAPFGALSKGAQALKKTGDLDRYLTSAAKAAGVGTREYKMSKTVGDLLDYAKNAKNAEAEIASIGASAKNASTEAKAMASQAADIAAQHAKDVEQRFAQAASKTYKNPLLEAMPSALDAVKGERIGGQFGVGLPFMDPSFVMGNGPLWQSVAGKLDSVASKLRWSSPVRALAQGFYAGVQSRSTRPGQEAAAVATHAIDTLGPKKDFELLHMADFVDQHPELRDIPVSDRWQLLEKTRSPRNEAEQKFVEFADAHHADWLTNQRHAGIKVDQADDKYIQGYTPRLRGDDVQGGFQVTYDPRDHMLKQFKRGTPGVNDVYTEYGGDALDNIVNEYKATIKNPPRGYKLKEDAVAWDIKRKHGPDGADDIDDYMHSQDINGNFLYKVLDPKNPDAGPIGEIALDRKTIKSMGGDVYREHTLQSKFDPISKVARDVEYSPVVESRYRKLAEDIVDSPEKRAKGVFTNDPLVDAAARNAAVQAKMSKSQTIVGAFGRRLPDAKDVSTDSLTTWSPGARTGVDKVGGKWVGEQEGLKLTDIFNRAGLDSDKAAELVLAERVKHGLANMPENVAERISAIKKIQNEYVKPEFADEVLKWGKEIELPKPVESLRKAASSLTSVFKAGVLNWPARYVRDLTSSTARLFERGMASPTDMKTAYQLLQGQVVEGLEKIPAVQNALRMMGHTDPAKATAEEASHAARLLVSSYTNPLQRIETELTGPERITGGLEALREGIIGKRERSLTDIPKQMLAAATGRAPDSSPNWWKPWRNRGWREGLTGKSIGKPEFGLSKAGDIAGEMTDQLPKVAGFLNQLRKGTEPAEAMRNISKMLVTYDPKKYTPTEQLLKDVFPFFSFSKTQAQYLPQELLRSPGGRMAATIKATASMRNPDVTTPDYIGNTAAIPIGKAEDGTMRYLTGLGLMHEDPMAWANIFRGDVRQAGGELISRANPLIKGPLEYFANRAFFQSGPLGPRELDDADPVLARLAANVRDKFTGEKTKQVTPLFGSPLLEAVASNSPATRALTTLRTATDPRKGWGALAANLLSGARVVDVSPAQQEGIQRELASEAMRLGGAHQFARTYFTDQDKAAMTASQRQEAEKLNALQNLLAKKAKERGKQPKNPFLPNAATNPLMQYVQ